MAKKLITAADVLKMKGYNMTALNGTEILGIIGEYYLKHDLSDYFYIRSVRFVSYKSAPTNGFVNLSSMDEVVKLEKDNPDFLNELTDYVKNIQTVDLITVEEDEIRTSADLKLKDNKMDALERDKLINTEFYNYNNLLLTYLLIISV